jgi:hypothetical protein
MRPPEDINNLFEESKASVSSEKNSKILNTALSAYKARQNEKSALYEPNIWRLILGSKAACLAITLLIISSLTACYVLSKKVTDLKDELAMRDVPVAQVDSSATINFYLREHQDIIAQKASLNPATSQPLQMRINQHEIMYYEIFDEQPEYMRPGIIVRGPSSQHQISPDNAPAISNGHTLTLSEARQTAAFDLVLPSWLHPCYRLDQIRKIEGRNAFQLLYTNGIDSVSLFEQPLDGQLGLEPKDFREYAVYQNKEQVGGTILAWRDDALSYVLIGKTEISQLMDMAQSINASK